MERRLSDDRRDSGIKPSDRDQDIDKHVDSRPDDEEMRSSSASRRAADLASESEDDQTRGETTATPPVMPGGAAIGATSPTASAGQGDAAAGAGALMLDMSTFGQDDVRTGWPVVTSDDVRIGTVSEVGPERILVDRVDQEGQIYIPYTGIASLDDKTIHLAVLRNQIDSLDWQQVLPGGPRGNPSRTSAVESPSQATTEVVSSRTADDPRSAGSIPPVPDSSTVPPRPSETDQTARPSINVDPAAPAAPPVTTGRGVEEGPTSHTVRAGDSDQPSSRASSPYTAEPGRVGGINAESSFTSSTTSARTSPTQQTASTSQTPTTPLKEMDPMRDARSMFGNVKETFNRTTHGQPSVEESKEAFADMFSVLENIPNSFYYLATVGSVLTSLWLFLSGKRWESIFVGLWAPTIISASMFYKLLRPSNEVRRS